MSTKDDLIAAKALIDTPEKWVKGVSCYLKASGPACAHEALRRASPNDHKRLRHALRKALPFKWRNEDTPSFNDDPATTHADIVAMFDRAIEAAS